MKKFARKVVKIKGLFFLLTWVGISNLCAASSSFITEITGSGNDASHTFINGEVEQIQQKMIVGKVTDISGRPLPGVTILVKGTNIGTVTDANGNYSLSNVSNKAILIFSFVGMKTQEVLVADRNTINVVLEEESIGLQEVVAVGYGTQKKENLTGAVSSIKSEKLTIAPITNVTNTLGGQLPGLKIKQLSGIPGSDAATLSIRGFNNAPLVIVDGVETSFSNIDASQIESISILKDGSASIYGARAGNGVVLVTLKHGNESKVSVNANASMTYQNSTKLIKTGSSGERAQWEREAYINAGLPSSQIPWTLTDIQKFFKGNDPNYLNTDWISAAIRPWAPQQNHNISVNGGNDKLRFFSYLGYNKQETISRHDGGDYQRYNIQTSVDANLTKRLLLSSSFNYIKENSDFTSMNLKSSNYYFALYDSDPRYPLYLPDRTKLSYAGSSYGNALFVSSRDLAGYNRFDNNLLRINASLTYDVKQVQGLKLKAFINYNRNLSVSKVFRKQPSFYSYNIETGEYKFERKAQDPTLLSYGSSNNYDLTQQYSMAYENTFKDHYISILALHERINYNNESFDTQRGEFQTSIIDQLFAGDPSTAANNSSVYEMGRASYVGRLNYRYKNRYLIETIFRADASAKFPKDGRWGYFPSISAGWIASEEDFLKKFNKIDYLKVRGSFGQAGDDAIGNYQYYSGYAYDMSYILGDKIQQGLYSTGIANTKLSWERISIYNLGLDFSLSKRKLYGTIEGFYRLRDGIPGYRTNSLPSTFGATLPIENLNSIDTRGFELEAGTVGKIKNFSFDISGNISWSRSKWVKYDEPVYTDPDQARIYGHKGKWTDERYGYVADGLFTSLEEIENLQYTYVDLGGNSAIKPGDVKYVDVNKDGKLDWRDQVKIGKGTMPNWMCGFNINLGYRQFDFNMLFQGAFDYTTYIDLESAPTELKFLNRWTEKENNKYALVPRPGSKNPANWWYSNYRNHNTSYLRLKELALGYQLRNSALKKSNLSKLRIYLAGTNLLTFSNLNKLGVDPEAPEGAPAYYYPQQRTISLGFSLIY